ncbi:MAG: N-acetyl-gamma-glutamyl-phosphate reductase [Pseudohongiellaceae bacterium]
MIKAGIIGATGYTGVELLRLLAPRNDVELVVVTSRELAGKPVASHFPNLRGYRVPDFSSPDSAALKECDVVFYATPHGVAMHSVPELLAADVKVIDLSADFRLKDIASWEGWYKTAHACPELAAEAVYGLPETHRAEIAQARLVAAPGCYPTAIQLALLPLLEGKLVDAGHLIADAKSGVSGAGRKAVEDYLLCEAGESIKPYALAGHRHHPEICQQLALLTETPVGLTFVPHLAPMSRGILATIYAPLIDGAPLTQGASPKKGASLSKSATESVAEKLQQLFETRYGEEPFVYVLPQGELPATRNVRGSNRCEVAVSFSEHTQTVIIMSAEDNLVKGASGQAVQCMNLMFALPETTGLDNIALLP